MANHAKLIPGNPYGKVVRPGGMTILIGALCNTGRVVKDVRHAPLRGHATNIHIRVHPEQPEGEDAFGYALADKLNNRSSAEAARQSREEGPALGRFLALDKAVVSAVFDECWPRDTQMWIPYPLKKMPSGTFGASVPRNKVVSLPLAGTAASPKPHGLVGVLKQHQERASDIIKHNTNAVKSPAATQAFPGDNVDEGISPEPGWCWGKGGR
eukprot:jgi/Tetstr1/440818/TSEL_029125.t1